jgi:hypothetical protein
LHSSVNEKSHDLTAGNVGDCDKFVYS